MQYMPVTQSMFLIAETRDQPMHVGGLQLFIPRQGQTAEELAEEIYERFRAATDIQDLFLKRPASPASIAGYTAWQHAHDIDFDYHVRRIVLPRPGSIKNLLRYVSLSHGALLDRSRPMWEVHIIEGLTDGRVALYTKIHHSLADGVTALRILQRTLSPDPDDRTGTAFWDKEITRRRRRRRTPAPAKTLAQRLTGALGSALSTADDLIGLAPAAAKVAMVGVLDRDFVAPLQQAPSTVLNVPIGSARRFAAQDWPIERLRAVARRHRVTFNDVLIAMCSGALRRYLADQAPLPEESLNAMVPVSLHDQPGDDGNAVTAIIVRMATDVADPAQRLQEIVRSTTSAKLVVRKLKPLQSLALGAANVWPLAFAPVPGFVNYTPRGFNLIISSVPGPEEPQYWNGARLDGTYPVSIAMEGLAMNITVTTVGGKVNLGVIGARAQLPRLQRILDHFEAALVELEQIPSIAPASPDNPEPSRRR
ncbi:WS/DGAT/MGAT family O-acyltransferase [Gordonia hirsuta]|uniref:WS/DGAT/MGAT family O-acyltransferase n=1 Tax=Gordonia hirsuta TaxID=53427 RepID=UPI000462B2CB|nr:wax ester/triacylglycerol synthase family O-acyltransferase [Gordonia hirsuta]